MAAPLLPRYRRPLTFGELLDETLQVYRRVWLPAALLWVVAGVLSLLLAALLAGLAGALGGLSVFALLSSPDRFLANAAALTTALVIAALVFGLVFAVLFAAAAGGIIVLVDAALRGQDRSVWSAFRLGLGRVAPLLFGGLLFGVAALGLTLLSVPTFVLGVFGTLGGLVALVAVAVWFANPGARQTWLKWLLILATPFGLVMFVAVRWSLWMQAIVLEGAGPVSALRRSNALVRGSWFIVLGVLVVVGIIVAVLQAIPGVVIGLVVLVAFGTQDVPNTSVWVNVANSAGSLLGSLVFGAVTLIAYTLLFVDLRNRHEGADLAERVARLEEPSLGGSAGSAAPPLS